MFPSELFNDDGFRQVDDGPQRLFMWLWLHPDLNAAGVIAIQPREWASAAKNLTNDLIETYAKDLRVEGWADFDDGQLWLKPFMLLDGALKSPSCYISAARAVKTIRSRRLREAVWELFSTFPRPLAPLPDPAKDETGMKTRRANGLNDSVDMAYAELQRRIANPDVRESLVGGQGIPHPIPHGMPYGMGSVGVGAAAEDEVDGSHW